MSGTQPEVAFEQLLEFLRDDRGFDFTGYKRASLMRRVRSRMHSVGIEDFADYEECLRDQPEEFVQLFNTILINVTEFFRDPAAWETLARDFIPRIAERAGTNRPIRIWSAGCAAGQETYTLVMALAEALGLERFERQVKVYATDADEDALARARLAQYTSREMASVPDELRERYFLPARNQWVFRNDLRRLVIFGRHDLTRDAPISHVHLLACRNVLMYFNTETQHRILTRFHFALEEESVLFLGRAEMMRSHANLFVAADLKARIFSRVARESLRDRLLMMARAEVGGSDGRQRTSGHLRLQTAALETSPIAMITVDMTGMVVVANQAARTLFALSVVDIGKPLRDLTLSYRPVELRSMLEKVTSEKMPTQIRKVDWLAPDGSLRQLDVDMVPLLDETGAVVGASVSFRDVTHYHRLEAELLDAHQAVETAFEELQATNEELETTNEELQSTIEELETTNEELQSTNEELETMNEELQSTNEELETINLELTLRTGELNDVGAYLSSILASLRVGVIVLDQDLDIRVWNSRAEDLWGLRSDEVIGRAFQNLDIGLPVERLKSVIRACMEESSAYEEVLLESVNRRGRSIRCRSICTPLERANGEARGVVLLMEEWPAAAVPSGDGAR